MPAATVATLPRFEEYTDEAAIQFYLGPNADQFVESADGVFVVEGCALPVHAAAILNPCLGVLREMAAKTAANGHAVPLLGGPPGYHLGPQGQHLDVLCSDQIPAGSERSLEGLTLKRIAHFLRFVYHPSEVGAIDFLLPGAAKSLSACARLAHQLDGPELLDSVDLKMEAAVGAHQATLQRLLDWVQVAEECGLKRLWSKCIREIAVTLSRARKGVGPRTVSSKDLINQMPGSARPADGMETAMHDMGLLKDLSVRAKLSITALLLAALRRSTPSDPADLVPPEASLVTALAILPLPELESSGDLA